MMDSGTSAEPDATQSAAAAATPLTRRLNSLALLLAVVAPGVAMFVLVAKYAVDIPFADEWTLAPFMEKAHAGTLGFVDFWTQHNEHRYVFPKVLFYGFTRFAAGNVRAQVFFSVVLAGVTSLLLLQILRRTFPGHRTKALLLLVPINLLLFSPVQAENWTWGFQFVFFFVNALLIAGVAIASSPQPLSRKFGICAALSLVATFSFGNGFILWATTFPSALVDEQDRGRTSRMRWLVGWGALGLFVLSLYFVQYHKPPYHPPLAASTNPLDYYRYVTTFLGANLAKAARAESLFVPAFIGSILVTAYAFAALLAMRTRDSRIRRRLAPWLGIGAFALISALLAAITRVGFGERQALDSRYTTFSLLLSISVIPLVAISREVLVARWAARPSLLNSLARLEGACLVGFVVAFASSATWGVGSMQRNHRTLLWGKGALLWGNVINSGAVYSMYLGGNAGDVLQFANIRDELGLMRPPLFKTADLSQARVVPAEKTNSGSFDAIGISNGDCTAAGWAVLRPPRRVADCIVLAYRSAEGKPTAFAVNDEFTDRPGLERWLEKKGIAVERAGWRANFPRDALPAGEQQVTAYALDAETGSLYQLGDSRLLP